MEAEVDVEVDKVELVDEELDGVVETVMLDESVTDADTEID